MCRLSDVVESFPLPGRASKIRLTAQGPVADVPCRVVDECSRRGVFRQRLVGRKAPADSGALSLGTDRRWSAWVGRVGLETCGAARCRGRSSLKTTHRALSIVLDVVTVVVRQRGGRCGDGERRRETDRAERRRAHLVRGDPRRRLLVVPDEDDRQDDQRDQSHADGAKCNASAYDTSTIFRPSRQLVVPLAGRCVIATECHSGGEYNPTGSRLGQLWQHLSVTSPEPPPTFDARALRPALTGVVTSVLAARLTATLMLDHLGISTEIFIVCFYSILFGGMWLTCRTISRRFGTGEPIHDFGLSWKPSDIWRGLLAFFMARVMQVLAMLPWAGHLDRLRRLTEGLERVSLSTFVIFAIVAMVGAPILEELVFRGVLQRSLAARMGYGWAIPVQALLFGLYHLTPGLGSTNVPYVVGLSAAGFVLGWAAWRWRRLGPSSTAHFLVNATSVAFLYGSR